VNEQMAVVLILTTLICACFGITWLVTKQMRSSKAAKARAEMQAKLLDKLGSSQELLQYLQTDAGQRLLEVETVRAEEAAARNPFERILGSIHLGLILTSVGIALLILGWLTGPGEHFFLVLGTVGVGLGAGFLLSSGASYFLSKSWGLFEPKAQ
jgi:ABC-type transport system involved in cytochrome bd biosynthesis fused ATPase/permease subunit